MHIYMHIQVLSKRNNNTELICAQEVTEKMEMQIRMLKEVVRKMLLLPAKTLAAKVHFIDLIQRLGVSYHFELEIDDLLQKIHDSYVENGRITVEEDDLRTLALMFRLLRQHGYHISPGIYASIYPHTHTSNTFMVNPPNMHMHV